MATARYYARNEQDKIFDTQIRAAMHKDASKAQMALYIQNQEILNLLRKLSEENAEILRLLSDSED